MEKGKEPYIEQLSVEENLYTKLQQKTINEVQRLSGKVWTDYNVHDPGVTLADIVNYALVELDYKLAFPIVDHLSEEDRPFDGKRFGLFSPLESYTTAPITDNDYRKLLLAKIPELDNVKVIPNKETGGYTIQVFLSPLANDVNLNSLCEKLKEEIKVVYHSHRNLCEFLEKVEIMNLDHLEFEADFEIEPGVDAADILAQLYDTIQQYLCGDISFYTFENNTGGLAPEDWLEGSCDGLRVNIASQEDTEYELYKILCKIKGVHFFRTCYLTENGNPQSDFSKGYTLEIPKKLEDMKVRIWQGKSEIQLDFDRFKARLDYYYRSKVRTRKKQCQTADSTWKSPKGTYHNLSEYYPIANDFPKCYQLSANREVPTSFEAYLKLYDQVIEDGLAEWKSLPRILSLEAGDSAVLESKHARDLKKLYLDFLDRLFGVESQPVWLTEMNNYGETEEGALRRRMNFLLHAPELIKYRNRAKNVLNLDDRAPYNTPTLKKWFCLLLGINPDDDRVVTNVLPKLNLRISEQNYDDASEQVDSLLINERLFDSLKVEKIEYEELPEKGIDLEQEYKIMRSQLAFFNENRINGDLFRGGTDLDNYRTVKVDEELYLLVYRNQEAGGWTNLGRSTDLKRLRTLANTLRHFLRSLNDACETVYLIEPVLADKNAAFKLMIVLPSWTRRFHTPRFQEECRNLLRSLIPTHVSGQIFWLDEQKMRYFEIYYRQWVHSFSRLEMEKDRCSLLGTMRELLSTAETIQYLNDTN